MCVRHAKRWRRARCCCADLREPSEAEADRGAPRDRRASAVPAHVYAWRPPDVGGDDQLRQCRLGHGHSGYRYDGIDPDSGAAVAGDAGGRFVSWRRTRRRRRGFDGFAPDACLINRYVPGARMSLHQDKDELDFAAPIVSVSLGLPAIFLFGGPKRADKPRRYRLEHGDVVVWGGPSRLFFHGVAPLADGEHALMGRQRINLTFRRRGDLPSPLVGEGERRGCSIRGVPLIRFYAFPMKPGADMTTSRGDVRDQRQRQQHRRLSRRAATGLHAGLDHLRDLPAKAVRRRRDRAVSA